MRTASSRSSPLSSFHYVPHSNVDELVHGRTETRTDVELCDDGREDSKESSLWIQRQRIMWMIHAAFVTTSCFLLQQQISVPKSEAQYTIVSNGGAAAIWRYILRTPPPYSYLLLIPVKYSLTTYLLRRAQHDEFPLHSSSSFCCKWIFHVLPELWLGMATLTLVFADYSTTTWVHYGVALVMLVAGILGMHTFIRCQVLWRFRPDDQLEMLGGDDDEEETDDEERFLLFWL